MRGELDEATVRTRVRELVAAGRIGDALEVVIDSLAAISRSERVIEPTSEPAAAPVEDDGLLAAAAPAPIELARGRRSALHHLARVAIDEPGDTICRRCARPARETGSIVREVLEPVGPSFQLEVRRRPALACGECGWSNGPIPGPRSGPIPGPSLLAQLVVAAHGDGVGAPQQAVGYRRAGLGILSPASIAGWIDAVAIALEPIAREIHERAYASQVVVARIERAIAIGDETWCAVHASRDGAREASRARAGWIVIDEARRANEAASWSAVRAALVTLAQDPRAASLLALVQRIYQIELSATADRATPDARRERRAVRSTPVLEQIRTSCLEIEDRGLLGARVRDVLARWDALRRFASDGRIPIDDAVIDRALGAVHLDGEPGERASTLATILGTCALSGTPPSAYLAGVLRALERGHRASRVGELLPLAFPV